MDEDAMLVWGMQRILLRLCQILRSSVGDSMSSWLEACNISSFGGVASKWLSSSIAMVKSVGTPSYSSPASDNLEQDTFAARRAPRSEYTQVTIPADIREDILLGKLVKTPAFIVNTQATSVLLGKIVYYVWSENPTSRSQGYDTTTRNTCFLWCFPGRQDIL